MPEWLTAQELLTLVLDDGSWRAWDIEPSAEPAVPPGPAYQRELASAAQRSGQPESILAGEGTLAGRRVALVAGEFTFLAGSIGVAAAERLVLAVERATSERLPLLAAPASGGTRMQEGTVAFLQMIKITGAVMAHKAAGLPYLVYLRHPTTGGVLASWGSLGHLTVAEPGALIGFLGPRVYEALHGEAFPPGIQQAEHLFECGLVDAVLPPELLAGLAVRALDMFDPPIALDPTLAPPAGEDPAEIPVSAWESVTRSRDPRRPGVRDLLRHAADDVLPMNGTGAGESHPGLFLALARFGGQPCVLLGQDRHGQREQALGPDALRQARRGMKLAAELRLPLLTVIDTPGAALSVAAEEGGLAGEIARTLADLVTLTAPTVSLLLGQGTGGAALALVPADRVIAAQHAWLAPLPPEGASAIVHRSDTRAAEMAENQGITADALRRHEVVDHVLAELPDAAEEPQAFCHRLGAVLAEELRYVRSVPAETRVMLRAAHFRALGLAADR